MIRAEKPDALLILGDTNSALAAIIAKRYKVPVFHMEAGNRCFDENVPEEINRRIVDHIADINLCYTDHARRYLLAEGAAPGRVFVTGSPMAEVLANHAEQIEASGILEELKLAPRPLPRRQLPPRGERRKPFTPRCSCRNRGTRQPALLDAGHRLDASAHRQTPPGARSRRERRGALLRALRLLRLRQAPEAGVLCTFGQRHHLRGVFLLGFPAVVLRDSTERPEAIDTGACVQTGMDPEIVRLGIEMAVAERDTGTESRIPWDYRHTDVSSRVVRHICGQARIIKKKVWGPDTDIDLFDV